MSVCRSASNPRLFDSESLSFVDGKAEFLSQLFEALVRRKVEAVEARVAAGQRSLLADLFDTEFLQTIASC